MTLEGLRGYLLLASGLTEVTRRRASAVARSILSSGSQTAGGLLPDPVKATVATVADELVATGRANRELMVGLVRGEIDRAVTRLGLVDAGELEAVTTELALVKARLTQLEAGAAAASGDTAKVAPAKRTAAKRTTAKRAPAKRATAKRPPAKATTDAGASS